MSFGKYGSNPRRQGRLFPRRPVFSSDELQQHFLPLQGILFPTPVSHPAARLPAFSTTYLKWCVANKCEAEKAAARDAVTSGPEWSLLGKIF